jgi:hypothetical protein
MSCLITKSNIKINLSVFVCGVVFFLSSGYNIIFSQPTNRIQYKGKDIFLSGLNIAWVNFAADLGPNAPPLDQFRKEFQTVRDSGGNAMRLWLFTDGSHTPEYNSNGFVTGPGLVAVKNLKQILDLSHHYNIGLILCLWSFDMLRAPKLDSARLYANQKMLTDTAYTMAFINNALVPMVDSVKGDSAIIAWEVCNEPNGMTTGTNYYQGDPTVPVSAIQKFTNLIAGAIHRTDSSAFVTTGPGSFQTLTDVNPIGKISALQPSISFGQLQSITNNFNAAHRLDLTVQQMSDYIKKVAVIPDTNYYRDDRLIAAGGDSLGTLDFYTVHYYSSGSTALSPFSHLFSYWGLTKPTVVAEFFMTSTDGTPSQYLLPTLYQSGYAGGLVWSWTDFPNTPNNSNAANDTWAAFQFMKANYKQSVDPFNINFPAVSITNPKDKSSFQDSTELSITAAVKDTSSTINYVMFFSSDSLLGTVSSPSKIISDTSYYSFDWKNIKSGNYIITALAENSLGQHELSATVQVTFGTASVTKFEAEKAAIFGNGITRKNDPTASGGAFYDIATNDTNVTVTWHFTNLSTAGDYPITFGYKLYYDTPKSQFININGVRKDTVTFTGSKTQWLENTITVPLVEGANTVQMQMWWGWMYLDYLAVPTSIVTSVDGTKETAKEFYLSQNYPNPFNPSTVIEFSIPKTSEVNLTIYNFLGQKVVTLINKELPSGTYNIRFDASNYSSGVYFYTLKTNNYIMTKKMILLK